MMNNRFDNLNIKNALRSINVSDMGWTKSKNPWTFRMLIKQDVLPDLFSIYKQINHFAIPEILDIKENGEHLYILKENIHGEDLNAFIKREGNVEPGRASKIIMKVCEILDYLQILKPGVLCYDDIKLSDIVLDSKDDIHLVNVEDLLLKQQPDSYRKIKILSQVQSVALLYYHMLTGINPFELDHNIQSFSQLGIYLPGEIFEIIANALKPEFSSLSLESFKEAIEKIFPTKTLEHRIQTDQPYSKSCIKKRHRQKIAGLIFIVSAAIMVIMSIVMFYKSQDTSSDIKNNNLLTYQETSVQDQRASKPINPVSEKDHLPASTLPADVPETFEPSLEPSPEFEQPTTTPTPTRVVKGTAVTKSKKIFLSDFEPIAINLGSEGFNITTLNASSDKDINDRVYQKGIKLQFIDSYLYDYSKQWMEVEYNLNGGYSKLSFTLSLSCMDKNIDPLQKAWLNVLGDGKLLRSTDPIGSNSQPVTVEIPIKGVKKLKLQLNPASQFVENASFLIGDPIMIP